jgi:ketosteroid isomerase-like protein
MNESLRTQVTAEIMAAMRSFETAERSRDAEALIGHFASVPTFHVYNDGRRVTYEAMVAGLRSTFPDLRSIGCDFEDIHVIVLASDAALATAHFRETVTDAQGKTARVRGAASWLWQRLDGQWRITYGQADHYPDDGA